MPKHRVISSDDHMYEPLDLWTTRLDKKFRDREVLGLDSLLWGFDYPHQESTFPKSQEFLGDLLADCTEEEWAKIVGGNAARVYQLG